MEGESLIEKVDLQKKYLLEMKQLKNSFDDFKQKKYEEVRQLIRLSLNL